jgi:hypothetical protein
MLLEYQCSLCGKRIRRKVPFNKEDRQRWEATFLADMKRLHEHICIAIRRVMLHKRFPHDPRRQEEKQK